MKEVTVRVPEERLVFFIELMKELGIEYASDANIPEEHIALVRERERSADYTNTSTWEQVKKRLTSDD